LSAVDSRGAPLSARGLAARVVERTLHAGAFLSDALDAELARSPLSPRDRALATELAYGAVRLERPLLAKLHALSPRGVAKGDPLAQAHLLVAAYQILVLDRVPAFAAVSEAVEALRRLRTEKVAGFANAVLRRLTSERAGFSLPQALEASAPPWLFEELCRSVGREAALGLLGASVAGERRGLSVRFAERITELPAWAQTAERGKLAPRAYWLAPRGDLRSLPGFSEGDFVVQEEGAQWAALALGARPGERVLDACAGHGQKSALIAEQLGASGALYVNDSSAAKLERLQREFERLRLPLPHATNVDLTTGSGDLPGDFDRVLVDAPCTGIGTLRRRPEIAKRLTPEDGRRLGERAALIVRNAASRAKLGGRVVYVVCSVLRAECEEVAESVRDVLAPAPFDAPEAVSLLGAEASECRLLPSTHGTDGYFVASFVRSA
jgi:16S rRNA (cytosine967-C5)-methyltransferase